MSNDIIKTCTRAGRTSERDSERQREGGKERERERERERFHISAFT